ncbi:MAG: hypothetical protein AAGE65_10545 [Planctomycetota bacterium]
MPRRSAKPPYEIFRNAPPNGAASGDRFDPPNGSGRGRRVLRLPEPRAVFAGLGATGRTVVDTGRDFVGSAGRRVRATRELWAQRLEQRADREAQNGAQRRKTDGSAAGAWWIASGKPVVLRTTRGLVVLAIAGVVGLVMLAYWLGRGDGTAANFAHTWPQNVEAASTQADPSAVTDRSLPVVDVPGGSDARVGVVVPQPRTTPPPAADPRVPGRNYLVYTMTDLGTARELAAFLRERDARILIVPTEHRVPGTPLSGETADGLADRAESSDTAVLHLVVDVTEGFTRAEYTRGEHHRFLSERLALGRAWKRHNGDRGSALESMTFYKYNAKPDRR